MVAGKCDFNENSVVKLDLDFGFRLMVCQKRGIVVYFSLSLVFFQPFWACWSFIRIMVRSKNDLYNFTITVNLRFGIIAISHFYQLGPFLLVLVSVELLGGFGSGSKASFGPTNVDYQLWFWKYINIFLFLLQAHLGSSLLFSTLHLYWELLMKTVVTAQPQPQPQPQPQHNKKLGETR